MFADEIACDVAPKSIDMAPTSFGLAPKSVDSSFKSSNLAPNSIDLAFKSINLAPTSIDLAPKSNPHDVNNCHQTQDGELLQSALVKVKQVIVTVKHAHRVTSPIRKRPAP